MIDRSNCIQTPKYQEGGFQIITVESWRLPLDQWLRSWEPAINFLQVATNPSPESPLWPIKGISFIANSPPTTPFLIQYSWILENLEVCPSSWLNLSDARNLGAEDSLGRHTQAAKPTPSQYQHHPGNSLLPLLVMDDQTVYWLIGLFPWLMVRIRMRRPSMLQSNSTLTEECESIL